MSTSNSNIPAIILAVAIVALLAVFYIADRSSSGPSTAAITHSADTEQMIKSKHDYETNKSVFSHSGYSGSLKGYLEHAKSGGKPSPVVQQHTGYSGSGKEYIEHHRAEEEASQMQSAGHHAGFSGSLKDYLAGKFDQRQSQQSHEPSHKSEHKKESGKDSKSHQSTAGSSGYSGSVDQYLKKYGG